jgi:hypothetical protein
MWTAHIIQEAPIKKCYMKTQQTTYWSRNVYTN